MKYLILLLFVTLSIVNSCQEKLPTVFLKMEGEWLRIEREGNYESWIKGAEGSWLGENFLVEDENRRVLETISIEKRDDFWYYIPDTPDNPSPVAFKITKIDEDFFYSENPEHDFPKWIRYQFSGLDSMFVTIGDKDRTVEFNFTRNQ